MNYEDTKYMVGKGLDGMGIALGVLALFVVGMGIAVGPMILVMVLGWSGWWLIPAIVWAIACFGFFAGMLDA